MTKDVVKEVRSVAWVGNCGRIDGCYTTCLPGDPADAATFAGKGCGKGGLWIGVSEFVHRFMDRVPIHLPGHPVTIAGVFATLARKGCGKGGAFSCLGWKLWMD